MKKLILFIFAIFIFNYPLKANFKSKNEITGDTIKKTKVVKKAVNDTIKYKKIIPDKITSENKEPNHYEKSPNLKPVLEDTLNKIFNEDDVFIKPKFNYNNKSFIDYINDSLKIPIECSEDIKCSYTVYFTVFKNGKVGNIGFKEINDCTELHLLIIKTLKNQPQYIPAKINNSNVSVTCKRTFKILRCE